MESEAFRFKVGDVLAQQAEFSTTKVRNEHNLSCQVPLAAATRLAFEDEFLTQFWRIIITILTLL